MARSGGMTESIPKRDTLSARRPTKYFYEFMNLTGGRWRLYEMPMMMLTINNFYVFWLVRSNDKPTKRNLLSMTRLSANRRRRRIVLAHCHCWSIYFNWIHRVCLWSHWQCKTHKRTEKTYFYVSFIDFTAHQLAIVNSEMLHWAPEYQYNERFFFANKLRRRT